MGMMAGLYRYQMVLFEILKSNDLTNERDLPAFSALLDEPSGSPPADVKQFAELYRGLAARLGLHT
jgi:hypothetical protein